MRKLSEKICNVCNKNPVEQGSRVGFFYQGLIFNADKNDEECVECAEKRTIDMFEHYGKRFVKLEKNKIEVDWQFYLENTKKDLGYFREKMDTILRYINVFSFTCGWEIVSFDGAILSPRNHLFVREEDVLEYIGLEFKYTSYPWMARHIDRIRIKDEILEKI